MAWKFPFLAYMVFQFLAFQVDAFSVAIGTIATGLAGAYAVYLKAYEGSFKQQLDEAKGQIESNNRLLVQQSGENAELRQERSALLEKLSERDHTIALRDDAIRLRDDAIKQRDRALDEQARLFRRVTSDTADLAEAFLIRKGDARSRPTS